jgi:hypothetical protein
VFPVLAANFPCFQGNPGAPISHREVGRLRVVDDDGRGRLLRVELVFLGEGDADVVGGQQCQELLLVGEVWSRPGSRRNSGCRDSCARSRAAYSDEFGRTRLAILPSRLGRIVRPMLVTRGSIA